MKMSTNEQQSDSNDEDEQPCGVFGVEPGCLQPCKKFVLLFVCLVTAFVTSSVLGTYKSALVSTFEKRFDWKTRTVGFVLSSSELGYMATVMFTAHFGSMSHRPRLLGSFTMFYGITGLIFVLPYLLLGPKFATDEVFSSRQVNYRNLSDDRRHSMDNKIPYCVIDGEGSIANLSSTNDSLRSNEVDWTSEVQSNVAFGIFIFGGILQGIALGPFWNVMFAFIDDMTKQWSGVFVGTYTLISCLGPILGYQIAARTTQLNENLSGTLREFSDSQNSPLWIGAWWLGYLVTGIAVMLVSLPLFCFPSSVPLRAVTDPSQIRSGVLRFLLSQAQKQSDILQQEELSHTNSRKRDKTLLGLLRSMKRIFSNPVFMCIYLGNLFDFASVIAPMHYGAKYLEQHFGVTQSEASAITGLMMPLSFGLGLTISIAVSYRFQMSMYSLARFNAFVRLFGVLRYFLTALFVCATPRVLHSVSVAAGQFVANNGSYCGSCSSCTGSGFFPVCGDNATTFYSPCAAGCSRVGGLASGCFCTDSGSVRLGACETACRASLTGYAIVTVLLGTVQSSARTQEAVITMRCVQPRDKALALASHSLLWGVIASVLPPLIGSLFDSVCLIKSSGDIGSSHCELYDRESFRYAFHLPSGIAHSIGCVFFFLLWFFSARRYGQGDGIDNGAAGPEVQVAELEVKKRAGELDDPALEPLKRPDNSA